MAPPCQFRRSNTSHPRKRRRRQPQPCQSLHQDYCTEELQQHNSNRCSCDYCKPPCPNDKTHGYNNRSALLEACLMENEHNVDRLLRQLEALNGTISDASVECVSLDLSSIVATRLLPLLERLDRVLIDVPLTGNYDECASSTGRFLSPRKQQSGGGGCLDSSIVTSPRIKILKQTHSVLLRVVMFVDRCEHNMGRDAVMLLLTRCLSHLYRQYSPESIKIDRRQHHDSPSILLHALSLDECAEASRILSVVWWRRQFRYHYDHHHKKLQLATSDPCSDNVTELNHKQDRPSARIGGDGDVSMQIVTSLHNAIRLLLSLRQTGARSALTAKTDNTMPRCTSPVKDAIQYHHDWNGTEFSDTNGQGSLNELNTQRMNHDRQLIFRCPSLSGCDIDDAGFCCYPSFTRWLHAVQDGSLQDFEDPALLAQCHLEIPDTSCHVVPCLSCHGQLQPVNDQARQACLVFHALRPMLQTPVSESWCDVAEPVFKRGNESQQEQQYQDRSNPLAILGLACCLKHIDNDGEVERILDGFFTPSPASSSEQSQDTKLLWQAQVKHVVALLVRYVLFQGLWSDKRLRTCRLEKAGIGMDNDLLHAFSMNEVREQACSLLIAIMRYLCRAPTTNARHVPDWNMKQDLTQILVALLDSPCDHIAFRVARMVCQDICCDRGRPQNDKMIASIDGYNPSLMMMTQGHSVVAALANLILNRPIDVLPTDLPNSFLRVVQNILNCKHQNAKIHPDELEMIPRCASSWLLRQGPLVEAVVKAANVDLENTRLAVVILMRLSFNPCHYRAVASSPGVLACLIRFVRGWDQHNRGTHRAGTPLSSGDDSLTKEGLKDRILALAEFL